MTLLRSLSWIWDVYTEPQVFGVKINIKDIARNKHIPKGMGWRDGSVAKGNCFQAWWLKFHSQQPQHRRELTPTSCPLASPQGALWHTHSHRHSQNKQVNKELKTHAMKRWEGSLCGETTVKQIYDSCAHRDQRRCRLLEVRTKRPSEREHSENKIRVLEIFKNMM